MTIEIIVALVVVAGLLGLYTGNTDITRVERVVVEHIGGISIVMNERA